MKTLTVSLLGLPLCVFASLATADDWQFAQASSTKPVYMFQKDSLVSPGGQYQMRVQGDCNLVVFDRNLNRNIWAARNTAASPPCYVALQEDGNLVIYRGTPPGATERSIWGSHSQSSPFDNYFLVMQDDGNLVVYHGTPGHVGDPVWSWKTQSLLYPPPGKCPGTVVAGTLCQMHLITPAVAKAADDKNKQCGNCFDKAVVAELLSQ